MTALELFKEEARKSGFDKKKDEKILEKFWSVLRRMMTFKNVREQEIGKMSIDDAIKAAHLASKFGFSIMPHRNFVEMGFSMENDFKTEYDLCRMNPKNY